MLSLKLRPLALNKTAFAMVLLSILSSATSCRYKDNAPGAALGETLQLFCSLRPRCDGDHVWTLIGEDGEDNVTLETTGNELVVSENVTSITNVGGKLYQCHCSDVDNDDCLHFQIGVVPVAELHLSRNVSRTGESVTVTCTAVGYPAPQFKLTHGHKRLTTNNTSDGSGVYYTIVSAKMSDSGDYECVPESSLEEYPNDPLQGNEVSLHLTVYEPPFISCTENDTVVYSHGRKQTAVLECAVDKGEAWLNSKVTWTMVDGESITVPHTVTWTKNVSYLIIHNVNKKEDYLFSCKVYSKFGIEDKKILEIELVDCFSKSSIPETFDPPTRESDNCDSKTFKIAFGVTCVVFLIIYIGTVLGLLFKKTIFDYISKTFHFFKDKIKIKWPSKA